MRRIDLVLAATAALTPALAQEDPEDAFRSLASATEEFDELSLFRGLVEEQADLISEILPPSLADFPAGLTVLIPSDDAFTDPAAAAVLDDPEALLETFRYHVMVANVTSQDFTAERGLSIPTLLRNEEFNLRSGGSAFEEEFGREAAGGQVLYVSQDPLDMVLRVRPRQDDGDRAFSLRSGLQNDAELQAVDGEWALGRFQIVNTFLELPRTCSRTIRGAPENLEALDRSLNRTNLWDTLDTSPNVTCLAPNDDAFRMVGNPDRNASEAELRNALLFHTLREPTYLDRMSDGQTIESFGVDENNNTLVIKVAVNETGTYFNNARVVAPNVLTNNGLVHVLDAVMEPLAATDEEEDDDDEDDGDDDDDTLDPSPTDTPEDGNDSADGDDEATGSGSAAGALAVSSFMAAFVAVGAAVVAL